MISNLCPSEPRTRVTPRARWHGVENAGAESPDTLYANCKRAVDVLLAAFLTIVLGPIVVLAAILVVVTSAGPAFYTQVRLGRFSKPFVIWKLRTMAHGCEGKSGPRWSTPGDRRVTWIGKFLRKLHIDEFPQLWNVLRGEMSLVGPRPERPEFFPILSAEIDNYAARLAVRPGVTGLAQVYLPPDGEIADVRRKQVYDLYYIRRFSLLLDLRLILATAVRAAGVPHAIVRPLLWLPSKQLIEETRPAQHVEPQTRFSRAHLSSPEPVSQIAT